MQALQASFAYNVGIHSSTTLNIYESNVLEQVTYFRRHQVRAGHVSFRDH